MNEFLFAYGTLMSSESTDAARRLGSEATLIGTAAIMGRLFDQGRWPGLISSSEQGNIVHGELWRLRSSVSLEWLDIYEGIRPDIQFPEYARKLVWVYSPGGPARQAWGYVYQWPVRECDLIPTGRWRDRQLSHARGDGPFNSPALAVSSQMPA